METHVVFFHLLSMSLFLLFSSANGGEEDAITVLPGQPKANFAQYGGYVTVDEQAGAAFFYYFAASHLPNMPLLLWLNGGPGCSSLGFGAMQELGPFRVKSDNRTLVRNRYAWNKVANVIFLESPSGVGFSYSNRTQDYLNHSDERTAMHNLKFLLGWFEKFPEYKTRDFYISGESYAGHFVPQLAQGIINHNNHTTNQETRINLKGILIGNPSLDRDIDDTGRYEYLWTHGLISDEALHNIQKFCSVARESLECLFAEDEASKSMASIDQYDVYASRCSSLSTAPFPARRLRKMRVDPCSMFYVQGYLNDHNVQKALHAKIYGSWSSCSNIILDHWPETPLTVLPLVKELVAQKLPVWIFSGDWDSVIPLMSTRLALRRLGLPVTTEWRAWGVNQQVAGFTIVYNGNLTYATVREAGHLVPQDQPKRALMLVKHFLQGKSLPPVLSV